MASPNLSEIITTTMRNRAKKIRDNVTNNIPLLMRLSEKNRIKYVSGGYQIVEELDYADNASVTRYSGYQAINVEAQDVLTSATYDPKQIAVSVIMSGLDMAMNQGKERSLDLLESRIENAVRSLKNAIDADLYSDGTGFSGAQMGGLQAAIPDSPATGTYGGINRATYSFWRPYVQTGTTVSAANVRGLMQTVWLGTKRNADQVDLILADDEFFGYFWETLTDIQRVNNSDVGVAGFGALKFINADVVPAGGVGGAIPAAHMYFLNTNYCALRPYRGFFLEPLGPERYGTNQDAMVKLFGMYGNLCFSNCQLQGLLID